MDTTTEKYLHEGLTPDEIWQRFKGSSLYKDPKFRKEVETKLNLARQSEIPFKGLEPSIEDIRNDTEKYTQQGIDDTTKWNAFKQTPAYKLYTQRYGMTNVELVKELGLDPDKISGYKPTSTKVPLQEIPAWQSTNKVFRTLGNVDRLRNVVASLVIDTQLGKKPELKKSWVGEQYNTGHQIVKNMGIPIDDTQWASQHPVKNQMAEALSLFYDTALDPVNYIPTSVVKPILKPFQIPILKKLKAGQNISRAEYRIVEPVLKKAEEHLKQVLQTKELPSALKDIGNDILTRPSETPKALPQGGAIAMPSPEDIAIQESQKKLAQKITPKEVKAELPEVLNIATKEELEWLKGIPEKWEGRNYSDKIRFSVLKSLEDKGLIESRENYGMGGKRIIEWRKTLEVKGIKPTIQTEQRLPGVIDRKNLNQLGSVSNKGVGDLKGTVFDLESRKQLELKPITSMDTQIAERVSKIEGTTYTPKDIQAISEYTNASKEDMLKMSDTELKEEIYNASERAGKDIEKEWGKEATYKTQKDYLDIIKSEGGINYTDKTVRDFAEDLRTAQKRNPFLFHKRQPNQPIKGMSLDEWAERLNTTEYDILKQLHESGKILKKDIVKTPLTDYADQIYNEAKEYQKVKGEAGFVSLGKREPPKVPLKTELPKETNWIVGSIRRGIQNLQNFPQLKKYPQMKEDIRTMITANEQPIRENADKIITGTFGKLDKEGQNVAIQSIYAKSELSDALEGMAVFNRKLNKRVAGKEAVEYAQNRMKELDGISNSMGIKDKVDETVNKWGNISGMIEKDLTDRGLLKGEVSDFRYYAPKVVEKYIDEFTYFSGVGKQLKKPYRTYLKEKFGGYEGVESIENLRNYITKTGFHNLVDDFSYNQLPKYDVYPFLKPDLKGQVDQLKLFAEPEMPTVNLSKSKQLVNLDKPTIDAINKARPDMPPLHEGKYRAFRYQRFGQGKLYLIPEEVNETFIHFKHTADHPFLTPLGRVTRAWKTAALLSSDLPAFQYQITNMSGDLTMAMVQNPKLVSPIVKMPKAIRTMLTRPENRLPNQQAFYEWITKNDVVDVNQVIAETMQSKILNPWTSLSRNREKIVRLGVAQDLWDDLQKGVDLAKKYPEWNLQGMTPESQAAKVARNINVDYGDVSPDYRFWMRGFLRPFSTFYDKATRQLWRYAKHHPVKSIIGLSALPTASTLYNQATKERLDIEQQLPEYIQNNSHFVLGKTEDGKAKVFMPVLGNLSFIAGGSIFNVIGENYNDLKSGLIKPKHLIESIARDFLKEEYQKQAYLFNPLIKAVFDWRAGKDRWGKTIITDDMSPEAKGIAFGKDFLMRMTPYVARFTTLQSKGLKDIAKRAMGFYEIDLSNPEKSFEITKGEENRRDAINKAQKEFIDTGKITTQIEPAELINIQSSDYVQMARVNKRLRNKEITPQEAQQLKKSLSLKKAIGEKIKEFKLIPYFD